MDHSAENPHSKVIGVYQKNNQYNTQILSALINERICNESYYNSRSKSAPGESNLRLPHTTNKTNGYRWLHITPDCCYSNTLSDVSLFILVPDFPPPSLYIHPTAKAMYILIITSWGIKHSSIIYVYMVLECFVLFLLCLCVYTFVNQ